MRYVVTYDVGDNIRRRRISEFPEGWGRRVEKSVFECDLSREELGKVREVLQELMAPGDRCHVYRLCADCMIQRVALGGDIEPYWAEVVTV